MEVKEVFLEEIQHQHPLILIDLQVMYQNYEEDDDDFDDTDMIEWQNSKCVCDMCGFEIDWYHRYYYKCSELCYYNVHKFCAQLSTTLQFPAHPHILHRNKVLNNWTCHCCHKTHDQFGMCYLCSMCNYQIDLRCATFVERNTIHHPCHPHPLACFTVDTIFCKCFACGKKHEGVFYHCATCFNFSIHSNCVALSFKILLQTRYFSHLHMLTLSFSFTVIQYGSKCRICGMKISHEFWFYKCSKCRYYIHVDCAISSKNLDMSISRSDRDKNFNDDDYPHLLHCPLPNESYQILPLQLHRYVEESMDENGCFIHPSHHHPLLLIHKENNNDMAQRISICPSTATTSNLRIQSISLHDPMKRIKLLCNGCVRPITKFPFYKCGQCRTVHFHKWCIQLPNELRNHHSHVPEHKLVLSLENSGFKVFLCDDCQLYCNGFRYHCSKCNYCIDVNCGFVPGEITHEAHQNHLLLRNTQLNPRARSMACHSCDVTITGGDVWFGCKTGCDFYLHSRCALHLPETIRHTYDKHSLKLSYSPIENHKSQYFCEVCEEDLNPEKWFYHCLECSQSIHSACAPLILKSEQNVNSLRVEGVYEFANIKFGSVRVRFGYHSHPLYFVAGTKIDGICAFCEEELHSGLIFKCLECKFGTHARCLDLARFFALKPGGRGASLLLGLERKPMRERDPQPQLTVPFFPSDGTRPLTIGWKIVE